MRHASVVCGIRCAVLVFLFAVLAGCALRTPEGVRPDLTDGEVCADLAALPQDLAVYARRVGEHTVLLAPDRQQRESERFRSRFFAPWGAHVGRSSASNVFEALVALNPEKGFAENLRPYPQERWQALVANCDREKYGAHPVRRAITTRTTHLRRLPTDAPFFNDPARAGQGFPFDLLQNSILWLGTPTVVVHVSRDGLWAFVETYFVSGWAKTEDIAAVDRDFIDAWMARPLIAVLRDDVALTAAAKGEDAVTGRERAHAAAVGVLLPAAPDPWAFSPESPREAVYVPVREAGGAASLGMARAPDATTARMPVPLTPANVARVGNAMMGRPYGWGGMYGQRDCSAAMRDLFAPFGIWLPRNSRPQGLTGVRIDLAGMSPGAKERAVMEKGVPFFSLVSMPGHIGLYLGSYPDPQGSGKDVPVMFHAIWGLRVVREECGVLREGRAVIGKAVATTLRPGVERPDLTSPASLLDRIAGLAILPEKE